VSAPGFKPHIKLVMEPGNAARLVDDTARRTLVLTVLEGQVLALMGPTHTAESLTASAKAAGLDVDVRMVEALLVRAEQNGFLERAPVRKKGQAPVLTIDSIAPAFRSDLLMSPGPKPGLLRVEDPQSGNTLSLHDFEVHVARLLDGNHKVSDVITLAGKIGVVLSLESLQTFIAQMRTYGLMVEWWSEATQPSAHTWPQRTKWTADIRELYQSALRLYRQGRPQHALEYLQMLLEIAPTTPEALELKERVQAKLSGTAEADMTFESLHGRPDEPLPELTPAAGTLAPAPAAPPRPSSVPPPAPAPSPPHAPPPSPPHVAPVSAPPAPVPSTPTRTETEAAPLGRAPEPVAFMPTLPEVELELGDGEVKPTDPSQPQPDEVKPKKKKKRGKSLLFFSALILGLGVPLPALKGVETALEPLPLGEVKVAGGTFHTLLAKPGQHVDVGAAVADLDTDKASQEKSQLEKEITRLEAAAQKAEEKARPKAVAKLKEKLAKAEKALAKANEDDRPKKQKALDKIQKQYDDANGEERAAELRGQAAAAKAKLPALQKELDGALVTAPIAGAFEPATIPPAGAQFDAGAVLGHIVDEHKALLPKETEGEDVVVGGKRLALSELKQTEAGLEVPFDGPRPKTVEVEVKSGWAPWSLRYRPLVEEQIAKLRALAGL
jgi:tetratricopeptide (TPR) repeat protein